MVHVLSFNSHQQMTQYLRQQAEDARRGLHPAQAALDYGDHWAQFADIANRHVVFGRISTVIEVQEGEQQAGATAEETVEALRETAHALRDGMMYGRAYDLYNPDGELGNTHKAVVWPIEESLFNAASECRWQIDLLPMSQKINLNAAWNAFRGHVRGER